MRCGLVLTATLTTLSASPTKSAHAEKLVRLCGTNNNAMIECGYSTVAECQSTIGKGATALR